LKVHIKWHIWMFLSLQKTNWNIFFSIQNLSRGWIICSCGEVTILSAQVGPYLRWKQAGTKLPAQWSFPARRVILISKTLKNSFDLIYSHTESEGDWERDKERECVCVCICLCICLIVCVCFTTAKTDGWKRLHNSLSLTYTHTYTTHTYTCTTHTLNTYAHIQS